MASLGMHFMLTPEQEGQLLGASDDAARTAFIENIEENHDKADVLSTDKAWDALHRCLTDGTLNIDGGDDPLAHAILGGRHLVEADDYFISYLTADQVAATAKALAPLDKDWLLSRYRKLTATDYDGPYDSDNLSYTSDNLNDLKDFFQRAAAAGKPVIFTVD